MENLAGRHQHRNVDDGEGVEENVPVDRPAKGTLGKRGGGSRRKEGFNRRFMEGVKFDIGKRYLDYFP